MSDIINKLNEIENQSLNSVIDLEKMIQIHRIKKRKLCNEIISKYSIEGLMEVVRFPSKKINSWKIPNVEGKYFDIFFRGPYGIALLFDGEIQAITSFNLLGNNDLRLTQAKGIKKKSIFERQLSADPIGLRYINSIPLIYDIFLSYARRLDVKSVSVESSVNRHDRVNDIALNWKLFHIFDEIPYDIGFLQKDD
ncbi:MAG: hypothetical protein KC550_04650, partial [Nanoarchaeota archaeon]|nr:hypothetical protein [Nanoarchaeota archaeon]